MKFERKDKQENNNVPVSAGGEERIAYLFQPEALLGEQYLDNFLRKTPLEPEKPSCWLFWKTASDVFRTTFCRRIGKSRCCSKRPRSGSLAMNRMRIFSFVSVCAMLGLDPSYIRRG